MSGATPAALDLAIRRLGCTRAYSIVTPSMRLGTHSSCLSSVFAGTTRGRCTVKQSADWYGRLITTWNAWGAFVWPWK